MSRYVSSNSPLRKFLMVLKMMPMDFYTLKTPIQILAALWKVHFKLIHQSW